MALRDFIKTKKVDAFDTEVMENAIATYEKNLELYEGKSVTWMIRITADELGMRKDDLCDILEGHYEPKPEE